MMEALKPDWRPQIAEVVRQFSDADEEAKKEIIKQISENYGAEAAREAEEEFGRNATLEQNVIRAASPSEIIRRGISDDAEPIGDALDAAIALQAPKSREIPKEVEASTVSAPKSARSEEPQATDTNSAAEATAARLVLSSNAPYDTAKVFAEQQCRENGAGVVWFWQGQFWRWNDRILRARAGRSDARASLRLSRWCQPMDRSESSNGEVPADAEACERGSGLLENRAGAGRGMPTANVAEH